MRPLMVIAALSITGCSWILTAAGYPPEARRDSAPAGVIDNALKPGTKAPDFTLKDMTGKSHSLVKGEGGTVLIFFRGYWCPFCRTQLKEIESNIAQFRELKYKVYAISMDDTEGQKSLAEKVTISYPNLSDTTLATINAYKVFDPGNGTAWPATFVVDGSGKIIFLDVRNTYKTRANSESLLKAIRGSQKS